MTDLFARDTSELEATCAIIDQLLEQPTVGLLALDRALRIERASPQLLELFGAAVGTRLLDALPHATALAALAARARDTGAQVTGEITIDGTAKLVASCQPVRAGNHIAGVSCSLESSEREQRGHAFLMTASLAIAVFEGREHRLRLVNHAWRDRFGGSDATGEPLRNVARPLDADVMLQLDLVLGTGAPLHFRDAQLLSRATGREPERFYTGVIYPVRTVFGAIRGVMVACNEVTDDVHARRLHADPALALMWSGYANQAIDYRSRRLLELTGGVMPFVHADDALALTTGMTADSPQPIELRLLRADGEWRWHRVRFAEAEAGAEPNRHDARRFAIAIDSHDERANAVLLDRERVAVAEARHANLLKDQFIASLSHELRAPITTLLLWERVLREDQDPQIRVRALDAIRTSAMSQSSLVADLLDVARAISGKLHIELGPVMVGDVLVAALDLAEPLATAKQLRVTRQIAPDVGLVSGDRNRLQQIFFNLLSNAVKFTDPGGSIVVSARRDNDSIIIDVTDSGRGISPELLPFIFEPFRQDETRNTDGLGLGLSIARQLAAAHGGTLVATSAGEGRGSQLTLTLGAIADSLPPSVPVPVARLGGLHLLLVDDDPRVRDALQVLLERAGAIVDTAESAAAGIGALERHVPDVVLSDLAMPGGDGYSFVRQIRQTRGAAGSVPAVAITAHVTEADRRRALAAGFDLYVTKPINVDQLISTIARLVELRAAR